MREECKAVKILAVNVNTTRSMTRSIAEAARVVARPGTEIVELTPSFGADSVEGNVESYMAAVGVMDAVVTHVGDFDAVIQAGFGEHGKEGLMELLDVPVVDITEAAAHLAMLVGRRYSVVTTLDRTVPGIEDRLACFGLSAHCASVRSSGLGVLSWRTPTPPAGRWSRRRVWRSRRIAPRSSSSVAEAWPDSMSGWPPTSASPSSRVSPRQSSSPRD